MSILALLIPRHGRGTRDPFASNLDFGELSRSARQRLVDTADTALTEALSTDEWEAERHDAETIRAIHRRAILRETQDAHRHDLRQRRRARTDAETYAQALAEQRRLIGSAARIGRLYRGSRSTSRMLNGVLAAAITWGAVNVQHNMMGDVAITEPRWWLAYGIEPMITLPLIAVMRLATAASHEGHVGTKKKTTIILIEAALLMLTLALNVGPHVAAGDVWTLVEYAIAPSMIAAVVALHAFTSTEYAVMIANSSAARERMNIEKHDVPADLATLAA